jgi:hypothetical protein
MGDAIIGDLSERFDHDCQQFGVARARRLYRSRTLKSLWSLSGRAAARTIKWGLSSKACYGSFGRLSDSGRCISPSHSFSACSPVFRHGKIPQWSIVGKNVNMSECRVIQKKSIGCLHTDQAGA